MTMKAKLTNRWIETCATKGIVWDTEFPSFGLRITEKGTKTYFLNYRVKETKTERRITLGRWHPGFAPDAARKRARVMLAGIDQGRDPLWERQERRRCEAEKRQAAEDHRQIEEAKPTLAALFDRWMTEHSEVENKPATIKKNRGLWRRNIEPIYGGRKVESISKADILDLKTRLKSLPVEFNRCHSLIKTMMRWAMTEGECQSDPTAGVSKYKEHPSERILSSDEMRRLARALEARATEGANPHSIGAIRLLALVGWRISEVRSLRWENVDFDRGEALLPDTKTGTRWAWLSPEAVDVIRALPKIGPFVFVGRNLSRPLGYEAIAAELKKVCAKAGITDATPHVFRASAATAMAEAGASVFALRDAFGWKGLAMPNRYVKRAARSAREAIAQHGRRTAALFERDDDAEVIAIPTRHHGS